MNRLLSAGLLCVASLTLPGCVSNDSTDSFSVGGVPKWISEGAKLDGEPAPLRPDPAIIMHESESGPLEFALITDRRSYEQPPVKKKAKVSTADPLERGRERRIRRLFR